MHSENRARAGQYSRWRGLQFDYKQRLLIAPGIGVEYLGFLPMQHVVFDVAELFSTIVLSLCAAG